jgi:phosphoribosylanthranilate isomerase
MADPMRLPLGPLWRAEPDRVRVKICCIASEEEASLAMAAGADLLGLVSAMPSRPGPIAESRIAEIVRWVQGRAATVLLTSLQEASAIAVQLDRMTPTVVQVVDTLGDRDWASLRATHPDVVLMPVIHVRDPSAVDEAAHAAPRVDAILLDSGNPSAAVKELGGTGRVHDWQVSRALRDRVDVPVLLAGGLHAGNVAEAIATVRPFGVDVCSGVRTDGRLDAAKVRRFVEAVRGA